MNKFILEKLSNLSKDNTSLKLYIDLIEQNLNKPILLDYDLHHILPKSLFPEFGNLNKNKWNCVKMPYWDHLEAHRLLSKITGDYKMSQSYFLMAHNGRYNNYFDEKQKDDYETARKIVIKNKKGKTTYVDKDGNKFKVKNTDPRVLSGELFGLTHGKTCYIDKNGNNIHSDINDPRVISGELVGIMAGKISVYDKDGNTYSVYTNDSRVLSGELKHVTTGKISVKDKNGITFLVDKNDPRYISGELVGVTKGKTMARDVNGNKIQVDNNDPRWATGEIVGITKGMKPYNNGIINKRFFPGEETEGFVLGMLVTNKFYHSHSDETKRKISQGNKGKIKKGK